VNQRLRGNPGGHSAESLADPAELRVGDVHGSATGDNEGLDPSEERQAVDAIHQYQQFVAPTFVWLDLIFIPFQAYGGP
jgi:hypothetical protein